jgi:hypothetical protein
MAQRATHVEVLRILISIGPTETMHFQTWADKAGNAPPLTAVDPVTGVSVTFPDLNSPPFGGEDFQTNLIMPEPCPFLSRHRKWCGGFFIQKVLKSDFLTHRDGRSHLPRVYSHGFS